MKINCLSLFISALSISGVLSAQTSFNYKTDPSTGVQYRFFKHNEKGKKPAIGDVASIVLVYKSEKDSTLFNSHEGRNDSASILQISIKVAFKGCLEQGITLMAAGDSASFLISSDSIYFKAFKLKALPMYIRPGSYLKFYIKLVKFQTESEVKGERLKKINQTRAELEALKTQEAATIKKYLKDSNINAKPVIVDSFYVLERSGTKGKPIYDGDSVEVKYKGMLLDGTIFDQSDPIHGHATFTFQYSRQAHLIRGWIEVLSTMHEGEKVKFLLPSSMAYGNNKAGKEIKPYAPLIFEIEVVKVTPFAP